MQINTYPQTGDLLFYPLGFPYAADPVATELPKTAVQRKGKIIHQTIGGNPHTIEGAAAIFEFEGKVFLDVAEDSILKHPEHDDELISAGQYELRHVQEFDHFSELKRAVVD